MNGQNYLFFAGELFASELSVLCNGNIHELSAAADRLTSQEAKRLAAKIAVAMSADGALAGAKLGVVPLTMEDLRATSGLEKWRIMRTVRAVMRQLEKAAAEEARKMKMHKRGEMNGCEYRPAHRH